MTAALGGDVTLDVVVSILESLRSQFHVMPAEAVAAILANTSIPADKALNLAVTRPDLGNVDGFADMGAWIKHRGRLGHAIVIAGVTRNGQVLQNACHDRRQQVVRAAATNPACTSDQLDAIWARDIGGWSQFAVVVARHPNITATLAATIARNPDATLRAALAANPTICASIAVTLAGDSTAHVRAALAANDTVDAGVFADCKVTDTAAFVRLLTHEFGNDAAMWVAAAKIAENTTQRCGALIDGVRLACTPQH